MLPFKSWKGEEPRWGWLFGANIFSLLIVHPADKKLVWAVERPKSHVVHIIKGFETVMFKSKFESWPQTSVVTMSEDGKGKVAGQ